MFVCAPTSRVSRCRAPPDIHTAGRAVGRQGDVSSNSTPGAKRGYSGRRFQKTRGHMRGRMPVAGRRVVVVGLAVLAAGLWVTSALGASTNLSGTVSVGGTPYNKSIPVSQAGQISATISWTAPSAVLTVAIVNPSGVQVALN